MFPPMELKKYLNTLNKEQLDKFARDCDTSVAYLKQIATGHRNAGGKSLRNIPKASGGAVSIESLLAA